MLCYSNENLMRITTENTGNYEVKIKTSGRITVMRIWEENGLNCHENNVTLQNILMILK